MAERRMFAKSVIESDAFLELPVSTRLLYFDLGMRGDDDGFVDSPKRVMRITGASDDDLKLLMAKQFLIPFGNGVVVIRHWKVHNRIRSDRYKPTLYQREKALLTEESEGIYGFLLADNQPPTVGIPSDNQVPTARLPDGSIGKYRLVEDRVVEVSTGAGDKTAPKTTTTKRFSQPTLDEVTAYCLERNNGIDAQRFIDYYTANGWRVGKNAMKDWKAAIRTWERNERERTASRPPSAQPYHRETQNERNNRMLDDYFGGGEPLDAGRIETVVEYDADELQQSV